MVGFLSNFKPRLFLLTPCLLTCQSIPLHRVKDISGWSLNIVAQSYICPVFPPKLKIFQEWGSKDLRLSAAFQNAFSERTLEIHAHWPILYSSLSDWRLSSFGESVIQEDKELNLYKECSHSLPLLLTTKIMHYFQTLLNWVFLCNAVLLLKGLILH